MWGTGKQDEDSGLPSPFSLPRPGEWGVEGSEQTQGKRSYKQLFPSRAVSHGAWVNQQILACEALLDSASA